MSTNNTFNWKRFMLLFRQHLIHNNKLLLYSMVGYCGVVFIVLSLVQLGEDAEPFDLESFLGFLTGFVAVFGILYVGYSFPAFRSKETSISYLTIPASLLEKFVFEFISRIGIMLIMLPLLFWITFHIQGYFFELMSDIDFIPVGISDFKEIAFPPYDQSSWLIMMIIASALLVLVLPFAGAAMFSKQPLVKTLFSVAIIIMFYSGVVYIVIEEMGLGNYKVNDSLWFLPSTDIEAFRFFALFFIIANLVMLSVAFLKLKEKEV